jgi:predicted secreted protein
MILKGQNFRILTFDSTASKFKCVGMATNCTVTLTNNTEDASTKDDVNMAAKPTTTSQAWSVQVESLDVSDAGAMLTAIKSLTPFTLLWDETSTTDNQTGEQATFARKGSAYLNDATFNFNDRENATKSLQFTGSGALETISSTPSYEAVSASAYTKGQFVRLFLSSDNTTAPAKVIAAAKSLSLHVSMTLEDATTKDTTGNWQIQEPTGLNYDISTSALVRGNDTITSAVAAQDLASIESIYEAGTPVKWQIANVSGDNQRTKGSILASGSCLLTQLSIQAPNRQNATYQATLQGYGAYSVGS